MGSARVQPGLYFADWMQRRGNESSEAQARRISQNLLAAMAVFPDQKFGLFYSGNKNQADMLAQTYKNDDESAGSLVDEKILNRGSGQAKLFQAFIELINREWSPEQRAQVRIVCIPTSQLGSSDANVSNQMKFDEIDGVVDGVHQLIDEKDYVMLGIKRQRQDGRGVEFNIGGGVSQSWTEIATKTPKGQMTRNQYFSSALQTKQVRGSGGDVRIEPRVMGEFPTLYTADLSAQKIDVRDDAPKASFIQKHPRVSLGLGITAIVLAVALAVVATIATCGAAGVPLGFLGAGIAAAGAATITGGFTAFAAVGVAGFALAIFSTIGGALGIHLARKEIEMNKLAAKPTLIVSERMDPGSPDSDLSSSGSYRDLNQFMEEHRGTNRPSPPASVPPANVSVNAPPSVLKTGTAPASSSSPEPGGNSSCKKT